MHIEYLDDSKGLARGHAGGPGWVDAKDWGIPVFRYDKNWWTSKWGQYANPMVFYTTSLAQCEYMEHKYLKSTEAVGESQWCPINWGDHYNLPRDNDTTFRRPVFWIIDEDRKQANGENAINLFSCIRKGVSHGKQLFAFNTRNFQTYLQLNLWWDSEPDGEYEYRGELGKAYSTNERVRSDGVREVWKDANGHNILVPLYFATHKQRKTNVYTTDEWERGDGELDTVWDKHGVAFYVHPWTFDGTTVQPHGSDATGTTLHLPFK